MTKKDHKHVSEFIFAIRQKKHGNLSLGTSYHDANIVVENKKKNILNYEMIRGYEE